MSEMMGNNVIWSLIVQSDFMTKMVMFTLFFMSVVCWAIALYKLILLKIKQKQCRAILHEMRRCTTLQEVLEIASENKKTLPGYVLIQLLSHAKQAQESHSIELFQFQVDSIIDDVLYQEEAYTPVLTISASVATLLGLFGTVWGLIHAFVRISEKQSADIVAVAPGISEALITTIAGLVVAIPALVFAQYIALKVKNLEHSLLILSDKVVVMVRMSLSNAHAHGAHTNVTHVNAAHPTDGTF
ncbi:MAG TPA: MotA/TolQ/ExbB proton channel family protein [Candidatus Saccharimonadales bacterium]|nr:MotA/TolQ/ExbB proton channel family protein [Candidatus Saccharimonadales bacterium]